MKKFIKPIFYTIGTLLWTMLFILLAINISGNFEFYYTRDKIFYIVYLLCILSIVCLFAVKAVKHWVTICADKLQIWKQAAAEKKAERDKNNKTKRIAELENELNELKKDG